MDFKQLGLGIALSATAFSVAATPQNLNTLADDPLALNQGAGYYIWNSKTSPNDWRVRWRANDASAPSIVDWFGGIEFRKAGLDDSPGAIEQISFETGTYEDKLEADESLATGIQDLEWMAYTNNSGGYDGFNFSLTQDTELMGFYLGSSLFGTGEDDFYQLTENSIDGKAAPAQGVFIGENYLAPNVLVNTRNGKTYQDFEILVPEPGTLALLGLGLAGLGAARRRKVA